MTPCETYGAPSVMDWLIGPIFVIAMVAFVLIVRGVFRDAMGVFRRRGSDPDG